MTRIPSAFLLMVFASLLGREAPAVEQVVVLGLFKDKAVIRIDGQQRILAAGATSPEGVTLISSNSSEAVLEIDGTRRTYTLGTHIGSSFRPPLPGATVSVAPDSHGMYRVNGSINGFQVEFVVDTGATLISMNRNEAKRMGLDYRMEGREALSNTASGLSKIYLVNLDQVRVGDIELNDVPGAVHDGDHPVMILLGNSFLSQIDLLRQGELLQLKEK